MKRRKKNTRDELPYFPCYASDALSSGTRARLTVEQWGAFWNLIFHSWNEPDGKLPDDDKVLAVFSGLGKKWAHVGRPIIDKAFVKKHGRLGNRRLMKERREILRKRKINQEAGLKSGKARRKRSNGRSTPVERTANDQRSSSVRTEDEHPRSRSIDQIQIQSTGVGSTDRGSVDTPDPEEKAPPLSRRPALARSRRAPDEATFGLYATIAKEALALCRRDDHPPDFANVGDHFKSLCSVRNIAYNSDITTRAVEAAFAADERRRTA